MGSLLVAAVGISLICASGAFAGSHFSSWNSVDGGEIRYEDYTKYDGARTRAINAWNALGSIDILPDDFWHVCDMEIRDVNLTASPAWAEYEFKSGADQLRMNKVQLDPLTPSSSRTKIIRRVMAHEMGHALGLGDHTGYNWHTASLMYAFTDEPIDGCASIRTPLSHDRADYYSLW